MLKSLPGDPYPTPTPPHENKVPQMTGILSNWTFYSIIWGPGAILFLCNTSSKFKNKKQTFKIYCSESNILIEDFEKKITVNLRSRKYKCLGYNI